MPIPREVWISHENDKLIISYENDAVADVVATGNLSLTGAATIDGVVLSNGQVVLASAQTIAANRGNWIVNTGGAWTQANPLYNQSVLISSGSVNAGTLWNLTSTNPITYTKTAIIVHTQIYTQSFSTNAKYTTTKVGQPGATAKDANTVPDNTTVKTTAFYSKKAEQWNPYLDSRKKFKLEFSLNNPLYDGNPVDDNEQDDQVFRFCTITDQIITMSDDKVLEVALTLEAEREE